MRILTVLILVLASSQTFCQSFQSGYVIKNNGDSSRVLIKEALDSRKLTRCIIKDGRTLTQYTAEEISAYGIFGGEQFITLGPAGKKFFAKILVKGQLSLYQHKGDFYIKEKEISALSAVGNSSDYFVKVLNPILADCRLSANQIGYTRNELTSIVQNYNRCQGEAGITFNRKLDKFAINYQVKLGYSKNTIDATSEAGYETSSISNSIPINAGVEFSFPRMNRKLSLTGELAFEKNKYQFYDEWRRYSTLYRRDAILDVVSMKIPVGVKYKLFALTNTPYISAGYSPTLFLSKKLETIEEREAGTNISTSTSNGKGSVSQSGFWVSLGYHHSLYKNNTLIVEARYESTSGKIGELEYKTTGNQLSLSVGIRY